MVVIRLCLPVVLAALATPTFAANAYADFNGTSTNFGSAFDEYSASATYGQVDVGLWTVSTGDKHVGFSVAGHNAASTSYIISIDYIKLVPQ